MNLRDELREKSGKNTFGAVVQDLIDEIVVKLHETAAQKEFSVNIEIPNIEMASKVANYFKKEGLLVRSNNLGCTNLNFSW